MSQGERDTRQGETTTLKVPGQPKEMGYFLRVADHAPLTADVLAAGMGNRPLVGLFCGLVPEELVLASGAMPVRLCGGPRKRNPASEGLLPAQCCPVVRAIAEGLLPGGDLYGRVEALVAPIVCDWKYKLADVLETYYPVLRLHVPEDASDEDWRTELRKLSDWLARLSDQEATPKLIDAASEVVRSARLAYHRLLELRREHPPPITGHDMLLVMNTYLRCDVGRWTEHCQRLGRELERRLERGDEWLAQQSHGRLSKDAVRVLLTGSPTFWPHRDIVSLLEEMGCIVVAEDICSAGRLRLAACASAWDYPPEGQSCCLCAGPAELRRSIESTLDCASTYDVDGVVFHLWRGCSVQHMRLDKLCAALEAKQIRHIVLESDPSQELNVDETREAFAGFVLDLRGHLRAEEEAADTEGTPNGRT